MAKRAISERYGPCPATKQPQPIHTSPCPHVLLPLPTRQRLLIGCVSGLVALRYRLYRVCATLFVSILYPSAHKRGCYGSSLRLYYISIHISDGRYIRLSVHSCSPPSAIHCACTKVALKIRQICRVSFRLFILFVLHRGSRKMDG